MDAQRLDTSVRTMRCAACGRGGLAQDASRCAACGAVLKRDVSAFRSPTDPGSAVRAPRTMIARDRAFDDGGRVRHTTSPGRRAIDADDACAAPMPAATRRAHPARIRAALDEARVAAGILPGSAVDRRHVGRRKVVTGSVQAAPAPPLWQDRVSPPVATPSTRVHGHGARHLADVGSALQRPQEIAAAAPIEEALLEEFHPRDHQLRWTIAICGLLATAGVVVLLTQLFASAG